MHFWLFFPAGTIYGQQAPRWRGAGDGCFLGKVVGGCDALSRWQPHTQIRSRCRRSNIFHQLPDQPAPPFVSCEDGWISLFTENSCQWWRSWSRWVWWRKQGGAIFSGSSGLGQVVPSDQLSTTSKYWQTGHQDILIYKNHCSHFAPVRKLDFSGKQIRFPPRQKEISPAQECQLFERGSIDKPGSRGRERYWSNTHRGADGHSVTRFKAPSYHRGGLNVRSGRRGVEQWSWSESDVKLLWRRQPPPPTEIIYRQEKRSLIYWKWEIS